MNEICSYKEFHLQKSKLNHVGYIIFAPGNDSIRLATLTWNHVFIILHDVIPGNSLHLNTAAYSKCVYFIPLLLYPNYNSSWCFVLSIFRE